ncbi:FAD-binding protein, partial [Clostridium sediminicola]|uniref:FAD-binding protein n=1 Tax=Clostridium sediminicola TaxID=3114879 RepID=UPI003D1766D6
KAAEVVKIVPELKEEDIIAKVLEVIKSEKKAVSLTDAEIIVSGGRGVGGPEGFKLVEELAEVLGGVVGASRAATDSGWIDQSHQIGQTGTT